MALIVEDGTGLTDAESYISVANADAYHLAMGNTSWAALATLAKEQALRRATQHLDTNYTFAGDRKTITQRLEWPRISGELYYAYTTFTYNYAWPVRCVQESCAELALRSSSATLIPDETQGIKSEKIGPITVVYADGSSSQPSYTLIDNMLRSVTRAGPGQLRVERI